MLQANSITNRREFRKRQRVVKVAVDAAKEEFVCRTACEAEKAIMDGRTRWGSIRKLQMTHAGCRPIKPSAVLKENGDLTNGPDEVKARWQRHFTNILNVPSEYRDEVIADMPSLSTRWDLDDPPTAEELETALGKLKRAREGRWNVRNPS